MRARMTLALSAGVVLIAACGPLGDDISEEAANRQGFDNFQTAVASDRNYDIYWLGREFEATGLTFRGPSVASFGDDVEGGGLGILYLTDCNGSRCSDVKLGMYSRAAWSLAQARRAAAPSPHFETKTVYVNGWEAELRTNLGTLTPVAAQILTIDFGDTVVEAVTGAYVPATPTDPQPNPLIDEAAFLAVMEHLRPYPE